jgi:hypothetical protein
MADHGPRVPGAGGDDDLELPCGETIDPVADLDMGMRVLDCACGETHAVVMDVHPPSRFVPESIVSVLRETVEAADAERHGEFGTTHLLGMVAEEFPQEVVVADVSENGAAGYALVWVADFGARRLHEVVVELVVELMEHAVGHADDGAATTEFEEQLGEFDVAAFVERYRAARDWDDEFDGPA